MSVYRSYFSKNNTLIEDNRTNNSQNPVTEISYGTLNADVSRFIFDIDLEPLIQKIQNGEIKAEKITKHVLKMTNTIRFRPDLIGGKFSDCIQQRTGSFTLELFNVDEDWDEGNGYDFVYEDQQFPQIPQQASNWFDRKTDIPWSNVGAYTTGTTASTGSTGTTLVLATQDFDKGNEDIEIDITDYVNSRIFSGETGFTATTFGLGLKFTDDLEALETMERQAVAFHVKNTNTFYEPFIETYVDDVIEDDRNHFFLDKENSLYLYSYIGGKPQDVVVNKVDIYDYEDNLIGTATGATIESVRKGVYRIMIQIDSDDYPDAVIFRDVWEVVVNGKIMTVDQEFYLINQNNYFNFTSSNSFSPDNYYFTFNGLKERDTIKRGGLKRIEIDVKEFYPNQTNNIPLDVEYRLFITQSDKYEFDVIPWTKVDRTPNGFEFILDTSWLIPQDYYLQVRLISNGIATEKESLFFTVASDGVTGA
jgi:hypothetical protein